MTLRDDLRSRMWIVLVPWKIHGRFFEYYIVLFPQSDQSSPDVLLEPDIEGGIGLHEV
jgi:hypothetical protein